MPDQPTPPQIAFIGAGSIGGPMAHRLIDRGHRLLVCDPCETVRTSFARRGVPVVAGAAGCSEPPLAIFMVADDAQLQSAAAAYLSGLGSHVSGERYVAIMSTVLPATVIEIAGRFETTGVRVVDAPVSGGSVKAGEGTLSIMTGGDTSALARFADVFTDLANVVIHCGHLGSGQTVKILNNLVGVTNLFLFSETLALATRLGLDPARLTEIMEVSSGRNAGTRDWAARRALFAWNSASPEVTQSVVSVTRKDLHLALTLARETGLVMPIADGVSAAHDATPPEDILERWRLLVGRTSKGTDDT